MIYNTAWALAETGKKSDLKIAIDMLDMNIAAIDGYGYKDKISYNHKIRMVPMITKACMYAFLGDYDEMEAVVSETKKLSEVTGKKKKCVQKVIDCWKTF